MKNNVLTMLIVVCIISSSQVIFTGYESTDREELLAHVAPINDAYLTSNKEEVERMQKVDDAYRTENQEEFERMGRVNDASSTGAEEQIERA